MEESMPNWKFPANWLAGEYLKDIPEFDNASTKDTILKEPSDVWEGDFGLTGFSF